jgi:MOSC domain-containing protein YiiM
MKHVKVKSVNSSVEKGTIKTPLPSISLTTQGVENDAHAGDWHRQVSMLAIESIQKFEASAGRTIKFGEFAENITTEGMELFKTQPGDRFQNDEVVMEVTQIGKSCHGSNCNIFKEVGACVMPKEGIFCRVIKPGILKPGDVLTYVPKES